MFNVTLHFGVLLVAAALCAGCANSIQTDTANVIEITCEGSWVSDSMCKGIIKTGSMLKFKINPITRSVYMTVENNDGQWLVASKFFKDCTVIDTKNWECGDSGSEKIGMQDGVYKRYFLGTYGYEIHGISNWRYWAFRAGSPQLALLWIKQ